MPAGIQYRPLADRRALARLSLRSVRRRHPGRCDPCGGLDLPPAPVESVARLRSAGQSRLCLQAVGRVSDHLRSEEHTSELQSLMRISYAVFCLKKQKQRQYNITTEHIAQIK